MKPKAVILLSGGLDSATSAALARAGGFSLHVLTIFYGQRHLVEVEAAKCVARSLDTSEHLVLDFNLRWLKGSALVDEIDVPKERSATEVATTIPATYVPARNTIFLSLALGWAESIGAYDIFIGANAVDYSGYPDCRPAFLEAFERLANLATKAGVEGAPFHIHAPLLRMSKGEIIRTAERLGVELRLTHSCYDPTPDGWACGRCDSCRLRLKGFSEAGLSDPIQYAAVGHEDACNS